MDQNLLLVVSLPFLAIHFYYQTATIFRKQTTQWKVIYHPSTPVVIGILTIIFFIVRNLPSYPFKH